MPRRLRNCSKQLQMAAFETTVCFVKLLLLLACTTSQIVPALSDSREGNRRPVSSYLGGKGAGDPLSAIQGLVGRILGDKYVNQFQYELTGTEKGMDVFELDSNTTTKQPVLRGNNGVALASAFHWYLKYYCGNSISWGVNGSGDYLNPPNPLPLPDSTVHMVSNVKYRYYMNVCTVSYSMVWWDWARWERELDWMAMNGINMPLAFTGQEYVWYKFYKSINVSDEDILNYFSGPAFLAWQRMGNIRKWGGPLDMQWIVDQKDLQLSFLDRAREFGMWAVLPGFAGHVPEALLTLYPKANITRNTDWVQFNSTFSGDYLLEPTDPLFVKLGTLYYRTLIDEFGTDHYYNADTYNEMTPSSTDLGFLASTNKAIFEAARIADEDAIFVMQGWLFVNTAFWTPTRVKAFLSEVPDDHMIILDLASLQHPLWSHLDSYFGKPFVWCLLNNYGGQRGIYANLTGITQDPLAALANPQSTMVGMGLTPEAIEQNPVMYDLMMEMPWRTEPVDVWTWISQYLQRRYGSSAALLTDAWYHLVNSVYQYPFSTNAKSFIERAPELSMASFQTPNTTALVQAWIYMDAAADIGDVNPKRSTFRYDLVDVGHQCLSNLFVDVHTMLMLAYDGALSSNTSEPWLDAVGSLSNSMTFMIKDLDALLASNENYLLGLWIAGARASVSSEAAKDLYEFNARTQVTIWSYHESEVLDYAAKAWGGLVGDFDLPRWSLFLGKVYDAVKSVQPLNETQYRQERFALEESWVHELSSYPTSPVGDTVAITYDLVNKYALVSPHNYKPAVDRDIPGNDLFGEGKKPWTQDAGQLRFLCNVNPLCLGYTSEGFLKNSTEGIQHKAGVTVYLKV